MLLVSELQKHLKQDFYIENEFLLILYLTERSSISECTFSF